MDRKREPSIINTNYHIGQITWCASYIYHQDGACLIIEGINDDGHYTLIEAILHGTPSGKIDIKYIQADQHNHPKDVKKILDNMGLYVSKTSMIHSIDVNRLQLATIQNNIQQDNGSFNYRKPIKKNTFSENNTASIQSESLESVAYQVDPDFADPDISVHNHSFTNELEWPQQKLKQVHPNFRSTRAIYKNF